MAPYPSVAGELSFYDASPSSRKPFFKSGDFSSKKALILIGGLTDGIGSVSYAPTLSRAVGEAGWMLYVAVYTALRRAEALQHSTSVE